MRFSTSLICSSVACAAMTTIISGPSCSLFGQYFPQRLDERFHLLRRTDGHAQVRGRAEDVARPHDDALAQQRLKHRAAVALHIYPDEIGLRGRVGQAKPAELLVQPCL